VRNYGKAEASRRVSAAVRFKRRGQTPLLAWFLEQGGLMRLPKLPRKTRLSIFTLLLPLACFSYVRAEESGPDRAAGVRILRNISYYQGAEADPAMHRLDLYLPEGRKDFPVLVFVHGGGWSRGDKNELGIYSALGHCFARHGIAVVCPNYRLSPKVKHPEHIRDVARAFAWTYHNIAQYGGCPGELFIGGHSAGGHLAALLAADESFLKAEGLSLQTIRGALPMSGLYTIPLRGSVPRLEERKNWLLSKTGLPLDIGFTLFSVVFGDDPLARQLASPIAHVAANLPPFLILCGDNDLPFCDRPWAEAFVKALRAKNGEADFWELSRRNHVSILWNATYDNDPATQRMISFILAQVVLDRLPTAPAAAMDFLRETLASYGTNSRAAGTVFGAPRHVPY
jgi:acetyl esterase/lipase